MQRDKQYLKFKITFTHVIILLIAVIMIGIFLFYIGFNAGKNENIRNKSFYEMMESPDNSDEIRMDTTKESDTEAFKNDKPDIKKELDYYNTAKKKGKVSTLKPVKIIKSKKRNSYYSIQVGSFKSHLLAKNYARKFSFMGYQTDISQFQDKTTLWFRVKVGNFDTFKEAEKERLILEKKEKKKFQTVKTN